MMALCYAEQYRLSSPIYDRLHRVADNQAAIAGQRLRALRLAAGFKSQSALARKSGVGQAVISRIEGGGALNPRADTARRLAEALGVTVDELMGEPLRVQRVISDLAQTIGAADAGDTGKRSPIAPVPGMLELMTGGTRPFLIDDPAVLSAFGRAAFGVVWVKPSSAPAPGEVVRVGTEEPPRLKAWEQGDDVTGVVVLLQISPTLS